MDITHLIAHPEELNQETLYDLRRLVAVHPTYHAARILFLQNLFILHDPAFDRELRRAALLVPDRRVLFNMTQAPSNHSKANKRKKATETINDSLQPDQAATSANLPSDTEATKAAAAKAENAAAPTPPAANAPQPLAATTQATTTAAEVLPAAASASSSANAGTASSEASPETPILPSGPRAPRKKYAAHDTTARLLDNFLDSTPQPLPKKQIKADPSTDYMSFLMQMEEVPTGPNDAANSAEAVTSSAVETSSGPTSDERLFSLIDSFIASQEEGINLSEDPMIPEGIIDDEAEPNAAAANGATVPEASAEVQPEPIAAAAAVTTVPEASAEVQPEPIAAAAAEATVPEATAKVQPELIAAAADGTTVPEASAEVQPDPIAAAANGATVPEASAEVQPESITSSTTAKRGVELSETLAQIYIKQQKYDRAIEVLNKISTDENSAANPYLADQMRFLQKLAHINAKKSTKSK